MRTLAKNSGNKPVLSIFDDLFAPVNYWLEDFEKASGFLPPVNIRETDDAYQLEVIAPGMDKADFKIKTEGELLTISAEKKEEKKEEKDKSIRTEYSYRSFNRSFTLNEDIDPENVQAKYNDGVLHLTLAKKEEKIVKPKEITVE